MKPRTLLCYSAPFVAGLAAYLLSRASDRPLLLRGARPLVAYPRVVEVGDAMEGQNLTVRFQVANQGDSLLRLFDFETSCGCAGVEHEADGSSYLVKQLAIPAGASEDLILRWTARGPVGARQRAIASFRTNDERTPKAEIEFVINRVLGGAAALPAQLLIGTPVVGETVRRVVEVRDRATPARGIERVIPVGVPDFVSVRLLDGLPSGSVSDPEVGALVGVVEVTVTGASVGPFAGSVQVFARDSAQPLVEFPVRGEVVAPVRLLPPVLVLPRTSGEGVVYSGTVLCRSQKGTPLEVTATGRREGIGITITPVADSPSTRLIRVELAETLRNTPGTIDVPLEARTGDHAPPVKLSLTINCRPPKRAGDAVSEAP